LKVNTAVHQSAVPCAHIDPCSLNISDETFLYLGEDTSLPVHHIKSIVVQCRRLSHGTAAQTQLVIHMLIYLLAGIAWEPAVACSAEGSKKQKTKAIQSAS
jgi:hypothetical protein